MHDAQPPSDSPAPVPANELAPLVAPAEPKEPPLLILGSLPDPVVPREIELVSSPPPIPAAPAIDVQAEAAAAPRLLAAPPTSAELLPPAPAVAPAPVPPPAIALPAAASVQTAIPPAAPPQAAPVHAAPAPSAPPPPPPPPPPPLQPAFAGAAAATLPHVERGRGWAAFSHLLLFAVIPTLFLGGVVTFFLWQLLGKDDSFVEDQTREALNFQINVGVLSYLLGFSIIGIPLVIVLWIVALVMCLIAALHAWRGERYRYPLAVRIVTH